jgi:AbrB family looped-hinge helix DNA binding protein
MGELVRVKERYQVTIPAKLREEINLQAGDYLDASICRDGILLRPKHIVDTVKKTPSILDFLHQSHGVSRSRNDIDESLAAERDSWGG